MKRHAKPSESFATVSRHQLCEELGLSDKGFWHLVKVGRRNGWLPDTTMPYQMPAELAELIKAHYHMPHREPATPVDWLTPYERKAADARLRPTPVHQGKKGPHTGRAHAQRPGRR